MKFSKDPMNSMDYVEFTIHLSTIRRSKSFITVLFLSDVQVMPVLVENKGKKKVD